MIRRMNQQLHFSEAVLNQKIFTPFYKGVKPAVEITGDSAYEAVIEMKTFGQILEEIDWPPVWEQLQKLYRIPDEGEPAYKRAFDEVRGLAPAATALKIEITECDPASEESGGYRFGVSGVDENGSGGIEFSPWSEWKGMEILPETLERFSPAEIAAHCLEEMTFCGFSQEAVQNKVKELQAIHHEMHKPFWKCLFVRRYISKKEIFGKPFPLWKRFLLKLQEIFSDVINLVWRKFPNGSQQF